MQPVYDDSHSQWIHKYQTNCIIDAFGQDDALQCLYFKKRNIFDWKILMCGNYGRRNVSYVNAYPTLCVKLNIVNVTSTTQLSYPRIVRMQKYSFFRIK